MKLKNLKGLSEARGFFLMITGVVAVGGAGFWGLCAFQTHRAVSKAEAQTQKGFAALAAETIDPYRKSAIKHPKGCKVMITSYYQARRADRLDWVSQACLEAGKETPEAYMGMAGAREIAGRDNEALQILSAAAPKFDKIPDLYYTAAQILRRNRREQEALVSFSRAIERAPENNQLTLEALEYASGVQAWDFAKTLATKLKGVETDNPEVKFFLARVFAKSGDSASSQAVLADGRKLLEKKPEMKAAIEKAYADVLSGQVAAPSVERNLATESKKK